MSITTTERWQQEVAKQFRYPGKVRMVMELVSDVSKADVIQKIYDWNSYVHNTKYWSDNLWTSWFNSKRLADSLKYIELEE